MAQTVGEAGRYQGGEQGVRDQQAGGDADDQRSGKNSGEMTRLSFRKRGCTVNHPRHYSAHPSGIECIEITEHMNFCRGNAIKYIWRASEKGSELEDLEKARWY